MLSVRCSTVAHNNAEKLGALYGGFRVLDRQDDFKAH
jgi:hypothetical protein